MRRLLVVVLVAVAGLGFAADPASAHARLERTDPVAGAVLDRAPEAATLVFGEPVEVSFGSVRIFDATGRRLDTGRPVHPNGDSRIVRLGLPRLGDGSYVLTWRVISADSHPVHGAFTFRVGGPEGVDAQSTQGLATRLLNSGNGSHAVGAAFAVVRFFAFAALVVLVGAAAFVIWLWPQGRVSSRVRRLVWTAWAAALAATLAGIVLQGAYGAALPLGDAFRPSVLREVLDTRFGRVWAARAVLLIAVALFLRWLLTPSHSRSAVPAWRLSVGAAAALALLATPGLAGHAVSGSLVGLALPADVVHLAAVSLWLGGLAVLAADVLPRGDPGELRDVVPRFSTLAFWAVVAILATGMFQGWRQVGSVTALTTTVYGQLLIAKLAAFTGLIALATVSRRAVHGRLRTPIPALPSGPGAMLADSDTDTVRRLRRSVGAEVLVAVVVLGLTALLVNAQPARSAVTLPFNTELRAQGLLIDVTVDPAKAGPMAVHLYTLTPAGAQAPVPQVTAQFSLPAQDIGPLNVALVPAGPGHFVAYGFELPIPGTWRLDVSARLNDFDQVSASTAVPIR